MPESPEKAVQRELQSLATKLNAAARDVVETLDDGLPKDLERRYAKGETDVYVLHLFGKRSKRLNKALHNRYDTDKPLRIRIDSYIRLFERLLDFVAEMPKAAALTEELLESETGAVYMLLAEASGRLGA